MILLSPFFSGRRLRQYWSRRPWTAWHWSMGNAHRTSLACAFTQLIWRQSNFLANHDNPANFCSESLALTWVTSAKCIRSYLSKQTPADTIKSGTNLTHSTNRLFTATSDLFHCDQSRLFLLFYRRVRIKRLLLKVKSTRQTAFTVGEAGTFLLYFYFYFYITQKTRNVIVTELRLWQCEFDLACPS